ncbi:hypothetical protein O4H61_05635 [Roseovarius aestuarii]|nr:hypothetical protein [Roseovarius aestuarii]
MQDVPQPQAEQPKLSLDDMDNAPNHLGSDDEVSNPIQTLYDRLGEVGNENLLLKQAVSNLEQKLKTKDILDGLIEPYALKSFRFMWIYCGFVGVVLLLDSFKICGFNMDPTVQAYLVGSTAVTVIGLVGMVLTGIFVGARK